MRVARRQFWFVCCLLLSAIGLEAIAGRGQQVAPGTPTAAEGTHTLYARGHAGKHTAWVQYTLTPELLHGLQPVRLRTFLVDESQPREFRWSAADYHGAPFDVGHCCEAAVARSEEAMRETFLLTNTMPQDASLNRGQWARLEEYIHGRVRAGATATVCCGPAFLPGADGTIAIRTIGEDGLWVPTHCWKAALLTAAGELVPGEALAWLLPNRDVDDFWKHKTTVDKLEAAIGFDLFPGGEEELEK